jgi:hypothetical protein
MLSNSVYFAKCWAENKTNEEIQTELDYLGKCWEKDGIHAHSADWTYARESTLKNILATRTPTEI